MTLIDPGPEAGRFYEALQAVGVQPREALRDPVLAVRLCACAEMEDIERFLKLATRGNIDKGNEDETRLLAVGVLSRLLVKARRHMRPAGIHAG